MAVGVVLGISTEAFADPSLKDQLNASQNQYNESQASLNASQAQYAELEYKIQTLDIQIQKSMTEADQIKGRIDKVQANIAEEQKHLERAQQRVKAEQNLYKNRLRAMYIMGNDSYLSALLDSKGFSDFISKVDNITQIAKFDNKLIASLNERQQEVENRKNLLVENKKNLVLLQAESNKNLEDLGKQKAAQDPLVAQYKADIAAATAASANAKSQVDAINGKITAQKKAEEAAKAEAEAEAEAKAKAVAAAAVTQVTTNRGASAQVSEETKSVQTIPKANPTSGDSVVAYAEQFLGVPYLWGGTSPSGFDCSGLVYYVYAHFGISIPRTSQFQFGYGTPVSQSQLQPGDLVFFHNDGTGLPGHVGMYIGGGNIIQAPQTGDVVKITPLSYMNGYMGARRVK